MKNYKLLFFSMLLLLIGSSSLMAASFTVSGQVTIDQQSIPSGGVLVKLNSLLDQQSTSMNTDDNGVYSFTLDVDTPDAAAFFVEVLDDCTGLPMVDIVFVEADGTGTLDFLLCEDNPGGPVGCGCPTEIDEVCVEVGPGFVIPFPNVCEAECAGFDASQFVDCNIIIDTTTNGCNCPFIFDEVCVEIDLGVIVPFPNACEAECAGYDPSEFVDCENGGGPVGCGCPTEIDEVCVELFPGLTIPFPNACEAECAGFDASQFVDCIDVPVDTTHCGCDCDWDPVCITIDSSEVLTFVNACLAECAGYDPADFEVCENGGGPVGCGCPTEIDEVCVELFPGLTIPFPNACEAECAGFDATLFVDCIDVPVDTTTTDCNCPTEIDEVCVELFPGLIIPFSNACEAECAGFDATLFVDCNITVDTTNQGCNCPFVFDPVCVEIAPGFVVEYPNPCEAECEGYDPSMFVDCNTPPVADCQAFFFPIPTNGLEIQFMDLSFISANSTWTWDFGDGTTSTDQNPIHTYLAEDTYEVSLTVEDANCTNTFMMSIWVGDLGSASFCQAIYFPELDELEVSFVDFSIGDNESWSWDFGDGNTSTEKTPVHTYAQEGAYVITVETVTKDGCVSEFELLLDLATGNLQGNAVPSNRVTSTKELSVIEASKVSPNPAQSELFVDLKVKVSTQAIINIRSIDGRLLQSSSEELSVGQQRLEFDVNKLPQGMYFLQVQTGKTQEVLKFIKQ